jgi:hypothetical protein
MTGARSSRRNPYRPGSASYAQVREAALKRRAALARTAAARAKTPETRRRARNQTSAARRGLRAIERRTEFRSHLSENDLNSFDQLSITQQERMLEIVQVFPDYIPTDIPDPFIGPNRSSGWRLYYSTRAGIRLRA